MKVGSLFSGGGLGDFGLVMAGHEIVWQVEIDEYCQKILALRYPESKKYRDIKTLKGEELEPVDIITGGFPCQPFSQSGSHRGDEDKRWLWPYYSNLISEIKPRWIVGENVRGLLSSNVGREYGTILSDLARLGYDAGWFCFPSAIFGSPHLRERVWIVANSNGDGQSRSADIFKKFRNMGINFQPNSKGYWNRIEIDRKNEKTIWEGLPKPLLCRMDDVTSKQLERLRLLGNGQIPACTYVIGKIITDMEVTQNGQ
jgi:DNA (cytosine-5)-methyltransferase 1